MGVSRAKRSNGQKGKSDAPGQALGYGLQYTRLTTMLLQATEGVRCSLEYVDDVAEESPHSGQRRVQSKSALVSNPVADRAKSLWKTLANWLRGTERHDFAAVPILFELYVSRPVDGDLVRAFNDASTDAAALEAIAQARLKLWGEAPAFELRNEVSSEIAEYVDLVLGAEPTSLVPIIRGFTLVCGSGSPVGDLEDLLRTHPIPPSKVRQVMEYMCGVVKTRVDELLERREPAILGGDEIRAIYRAYVRKIDSDTLLTSYARRPSRDQAMRNMPAAFVHQLDLIGLGFEDKLEAINDYLMAVADRTEWAKAGEIDGSSFDELDGVLTRTWKNRKKSLAIQHANLVAEQQGELLYRDCLITRAPLQAKDTPQHFIPGCLHRLAEGLTIGWHPKYEDLMKVKKAA
jgi:hypothetical protein